MATVADHVLRVGIIGLGIGALHAEGYAASDDAKVVALCNTGQDRLYTLADQYHVPAKGCFTDYREMLRKASLDVVSVCLPNYLHAPVAIEALNAGLHALCEKPMALTVLQAQEMISAASRNNRRLAIAYNYRYRADVAWIRDLIASGKLGEVYHVHAAWQRETGIPGSGWFGQKTLSGGGPLIDLGVHILDLTLYLLGFPSVETVSCVTRSVFGKRGLKTWGSVQVNPAFDVEDGAVSLIRFANGISAVLEATWAEHRQPGDDLIRLEIEGTQGTVVLNIPNYRENDTLRFYTEIQGKAATIVPLIPPTRPTGHTALIVEMVRCLKAEEPLPTDAAQGLKAAQVLEALYESARTSREVVIHPLPEKVH